MAAVGFTTDVKEIIAAGAPSNLLIALAIVLGAVGFIMLVARKMKFYPIELLSLLDFVWQTEEEQETLQF